MERRRRRRSAQPSPTTRKELWAVSIGSLTAISAGLVWILSLSFFGGGAIDVPGISEAALLQGELVLVGPPVAASDKLTAELAALPPDARAKRYRELADASRRQADRTLGSIRASYLSIAAQWRALAAAIEISGTEECSE